jgi:hypothetical protein
MEPLWSPVGATGGNRSQIARAEKPPKQAKTVAVGGDLLPSAAHGKRRVDPTSLLLKRGVTFLAPRGSRVPLSAGRASSMVTVTDRKSRNVGCRVRRWLVPIKSPPLRRHPTRSGIRACVYLYSYACVVGLHEVCRADSSGAPTTRAPTSPPSSRCPRTRSRARSAAGRATSDRIPLTRHRCRNAATVERPAAGAPSLHDLDPFVAMLRPGMVDGERRVGHLSP